MVYPSLTRRIMSYFIDVIFLFIIYSLLSLIFNTNNPASQSVRVFVFFAFLFLYEPILVATTGTIGQNILGIAVRSNKDYSQKINIFQSFGRFIVKGLLGWISFFAFVFSKKNRTFHDYTVNSIMLYKKDALKENTGRGIEEEPSEEQEEELSESDKTEIDKK